MNNKRRERLRRAIYLLREAMTSLKGSGHKDAAETIEQAVAAIHQAIIMR